MISRSAAVYAGRQNQLQKWTRQRETLSESSRLCSTLAVPSFRRNQQNPVCVFRPSEAAAQASESHLQLRGRQPGRADLLRGRGDRGGRRGGPGVVGQYLRHAASPAHVLERASSCQRPPAGSRCSAEVTVFSRSLPLRPGSPAATDPSAGKNPLLCNC